MKLFSKNTTTLFFTSFFSLFLFINFEAKSDNDEFVIQVDKRGYKSKSSTFYVNSFEDFPDINPRDNKCLTIQDKCSLRAAIMQANHNSRHDKIILDSGIYQLNRIDISDGNEETLGVVGDLDIKNPLTIEGQGSSKTIIISSHQSRIFDIRKDSQKVRIKSLQLMNNSKAFSNDVHYGGCIQTESSLSIEDVHLNNCSSKYIGGAIHVWGKTSNQNQKTPEILIKNSSLNNNESFLIGAGLSIYNQANVKIEKSQFFNNRLRDSHEINYLLYGAGLAFLSHKGQLFIEKSRFDTNIIETNHKFFEWLDNGNPDYSDVGENSNTFGGAVFTTVPTSIFDSEFENNSAYFGGAIAISQSLPNPSYSNISLRHQYHLEPKKPKNKIPFFISRSLFHKNEGMYGGAIYNHNTNKTKVSEDDHGFIMNSTFSNNRALENHSVLYTKNSVLSLIHNTIIYNRDEFGMPILSERASLIKLKSNLFYQNSSTYSLHNTHICKGKIISLGYNLLPTVDENRRRYCEIMSHHSNLDNKYDPAETIVDDFLVPNLKNNGGLTKTYMIKRKRSVHNVIPSKDCRYFFLGQTDQRGYPRTKAHDDEELFCDIGAVELQSN